MLKRPRKHHYVPATYLKQFVVPGTSRLALLDMTTGDIRLQRPRKVMRVHDYYRQRHAPKGIDEFCFEIDIGKRIESQIVRLIGKVIAGGTDITEEELVLLLQHMELQRIRVPQQAEFASGLARAQIESMVMDSPELPNGKVGEYFKVEIKDEFRFNFMREMVEAQIYTRYFSRMIWKAWKMPEECHVVTTDSPITIFNPDYPHLIEAGIGRLGSITLYPLTPSWCLEMIHPEKESDPDFDPAGTVEVEWKDLQRVELRVGAEMPVEKAKAANGILTMRARRFVAADSPELLEELRDSLLSPA